MNHLYAIETQKLTKHFIFKGKSITALQDVNLSIPYGEVFGIMGPNGAGKTTLIKILATLLLPTSGDAYVAGYNLKNSNKIKNAIGLISSDERSFYWRLSGMENLKFFASLHNLSSTDMKLRIEWIIDNLQLSEFIGRRFDSYSTGMKQKMSIARSLISEPRILFVDEPTKGIDPISALHITGILRNLAENGITIFLITHNAEEAREICRRVAIMDKGRVLAELNPVNCDIKLSMFELLEMREKC